jgi:hypothetical protein
LRNRQNAQLLFYKAARRPRRHADALIEAARDIPGTSSSANIRYSVGRALIRAAPRHAPTRQQYEKQAAEQLERSLDSGNLGRVRDEKALNCLRTIGR